MNDYSEIEDNVKDSEENGIISFLSASDNDNVASSPPELDNAPFGWTRPGPPDDWKFSIDSKRGEPEFNAIDNPGKWSSFTFRAKFSSAGAAGKYTHHVMPAGAIPVPRNPENCNKRMECGYEFHYDGWKHQSPTKFNTREGATRDDLFPTSRRCQLDGNLLEKMGLTAERMKKKDALFFYQLLCPLIDPLQSGITDDPRQGFYTEVAHFTNMYAVGKRKRNGDYGHGFRLVNAEELVNWDGIVARNVGKSIGDCWDSSKENLYDPVIDETMGLRRWLDIKANMKTSNFNLEKKRGDEGYDPTQKYRLIWDVAVHNINAFVKKAGLDCTIDETSWANGSYSDVHGRVKGKPGLCKGGQHTLCLDTHHRFMYCYTPRHKFFSREAPFTQEGPAEVKRIVELLKPLVIGVTEDDSDRRRQIFEEPPCLSMDNHFSGDNVSQFLGEEGWKGIFTCRRDRLPRKCPSKYFHHLKQVEVSKRSRAA